MQMAHTNYKGNQNQTLTTNSSEESIELKNIYVQEKTNYDQANQAYQIQMQERQERHDINEMRVEEG